MPSQDTKTPPPPPVTKPAPVNIKPQLPEFPPNRIIRGFLTQMYARFWNDLADHASA